MSAVFPPSNDADGIPADSIVPDVSVCEASATSIAGVGPKRHSHSRREIEDRLDAAIREMGDRSVKAMDDGDPTGARLWSERMYVAIKSRAPEHKARLHDELEQRLNDGADYFAHQGRLMAELAKREQEGQA